MLDRCLKSLNHAQLIIVHLCLAPSISARYLLSFITISYQLIIPNNQTWTAMNNPTIPTVIHSPSQHPHHHQPTKIESSLPHLHLPLCTSITETAHRYYQDYINSFNQNNQLNNKLMMGIDERNQLAERYNLIKVPNQKQKVADDYVKRRRREAKDIDRSYFCPVEKCHKGYGSEGSLTHHVRLKHASLYESGKYQLFLQRLLKSMNVVASISLKQVQVKKEQE